MTNRIRKARLALLLAGTALLASSNAYAAQPAATDLNAPPASPIPAQATDPAPTTVETVVVSARRRNEELKDVPTAVTVFTADKLDDIGAKDITELTRSTPNLIFRSRAVLTRLLTCSCAVSVKAIRYGASNPASASTSTTSTTPAPQGAILDVYNVDRIEVLRGPQGTLYGRNTEGGAVKFVTAALPDQLAFWQRARLELTAKLTRI